MTDSSKLFVFSEEEKEIDVNLNVWKILTVEDDINYQNALTNSLKELLLENGHQLKILTANSVSQAAAVLSAHPDIALTFIDVVMEEDDSGLRLVDTIREVLGNSDMRIVLLTGQPGFAPEQDTMKSLDIDEYWNKSDITVEKLQSIVTSNLRTWTYISQISAAKKGLQLVLDASRSINSKHDMGSFSCAVLEEISNILNITEGGGILCSSSAVNISEHPVILSANGCFKGFEGRVVESDLFSDIYLDIQRAINEKQHVFSAHHTIFFFDAANLVNKNYITVVKSDNPISEQNEYLLKVFSENVSTGFSNLVLLNKLTELAYTDVSLNLHNRNWLTREIRNMNLNEQSETRLLVFEISQLAEKSFTFGHDFCQKLLTEVHDNIFNVFAANSPRIALINKRSFGVLIHVDAEISAEMFAALHRQKCEVENVKQYVDVRILALELSSILDVIPEKIVSLAESSLDDLETIHTKYIEHDASKTEALTRRYKLLAKLSTTIGSGGLRVALQPKMDLVNLIPIGFEALARWQLGDGSFVNPEEFIELAETAGLINELDSAIFDQILLTIKQLKVVGIHLPVAFNASPYDLVNPLYFECIAKKLKESDIPPTMLELEVTETQAISNYDLIRDSLERFMQLGVKVSIDDFGTGYSSLSHITEIPANILKVDRCFVSDIEHNENNQYILEMILKLGKQFNFSIIVEGIETQSQCDWVKKAGCNVAQGYYFSKPLFIDDLILWLKPYAGK
ncbi:MAG: EAL domain-containing protein [Cognaticolwellia sp.]